MSSSLSLSPPDNLKNAVADVVFIWDGSGALSEMTSTIIYEYILNFLKPLNYGPKGVRAAMVTYEDKVINKIRFDEASTVEEFEKLLSSRGPPQGNEEKAGVDEAFRVTIDEILNEKNGSRRDVPRLVVFFVTQRATGPNPSVRAARLRQLAEVFVVSCDTPWTMTDEELLELAGDRSHLFQYDDANVEETLAPVLPLITWRALADAVDQTFTISFTDNSTTFDDEFKAIESEKHKKKVQTYHDEFALVCQHSALRAVVIDVMSLQRTDTNRTRISAKTTFAGYGHGLEGSTIKSALEYQASKREWKELKAEKLIKDA